MNQKKQKVIILKVNLDKILSREKKGWQLCNKYWLSKTRKIYASIDNSQRIHDKKYDTESYIAGWND